MLGAHPRNRSLEGGVTRQRTFGSDTPFCAWMRRCKDLPSVGADFGFAASDNDLTVHRYMTSVDGLGTRDIQSIMQIEIKTRRGEPLRSQLDTLSKLNLFAGQKYIEGQHIRFFGVFFLVMDGTSPDDSRLMWWGTLPKNAVVDQAREIQWRRIGYAQLVGLLRFDLHPGTFERHVLRRHHKTREIVSVDRMPLGFLTETRLIVRS